MTILMNAAEAVHNDIPGEPWMYGVAGLVVLLGLLYIVTRFNPDK
jgi:hypothetical protein